nr:cupredoxin domain-containing protein [Neobacillus sp. Marseille-Q6967]
MLMIFSLVLVFLLSSYVVFYTFQNKNRLSCMTGMMISMTNSMMVSIAVGTIIGTLLENKDLTIPTIISVTTGMAVGFITGRPVSLMASLDGLTAGIMGGMMGSMLGVMLQPKSTEVMVFFIDIVFVAVIGILIRLIGEETKSNKPESQSKKPLVANPIFLVMMLLFMGFLAFGSGGEYKNGTEQASTEVEEIEFKDTSNEIHEIIVEPTEYTPNNTVIKAGTPSILNFKTEEVGCTGIVLSEELGFNISLKAHTDNYVTIPSLKPGTYHYACGMNMYKGTITVQ